MLVVAPEGAPEFTDATVGDLPGWLRAGDVLVFNDTRVIPAELTGTRVRGEATTTIAFNLIERVDGARWRAFARPGKRLKVGDRVRFGEGARVCLLGEVWATVTAKDEDGNEVQVIKVVAEDVALQLSRIDSITFTQARARETADAES